MPDATTLVLISRNSGRVSIEFVFFALWLARLADFISPLFLRSLTNLLGAACCFFCLAIESAPQNRLAVSDDKMKADRNNYS